MDLPDRSPARPKPWVSLGVVALVSFAAQLWLCRFFTFGATVPLSIDVNPSNLWKFAYHFPPTGTFQVLNWLGVAYLPQPLTPFSLASAWMPTWLFFTAYAPLMATLALLAMAAFLRELEIPRAAALFGAVIYAWQGDILPFVYPGHYAYITSWPFFALAAWGALRAGRTGHWAYALIAGACCGTLVGLPSNTDRGGIDSLLVAALFLTPLLDRNSNLPRWKPMLNLAICGGVALVIALAPLLSLFQSYVVGVKLGGLANREETFKLATQFSLGPAETLVYLVPGFCGWHTNSVDGPYWGWIGEWPSWPHTGLRNLNLGISTTGTLATTLALAGILLLLPGRLLGPDTLSTRQRLYTRVLLTLGAVALVLAWGWHTGLYHILYQLPLMDKWRNPLKWLELTNFALVVLSAVGMQQVVASMNDAAPEVKSIRTRVGWFFIFVLILLFICLLASYPFAISLAGKLQLELFSDPEIAAIMDTLHTSILVALLTLGSACLVLCALWSPGFLRRAELTNPWLNRLWHRAFEAGHLAGSVAVLFATIAAVQLGWVSTKFIEPQPLSTLTNVLPMLAALHNEGDRVRVSVAVDDPTLQTLLQNQFAALNISSLEVSAASRIPDDLGTFFNAFSKNQARLWYLAGVKNLAVAQDEVGPLHADASIGPNIDHADGYTIGVPESLDLPTHAIVGLKNFLNKVTFVPGLILLTEDDVLKTLADPAWNPLETILVARPATISEPSPSSPPAASDQLELTTYTPTEIDINAHVSRGGFILIDDQYDPDWQVQVNGHDEPLIRADYILRAVGIPAGDSKITLHYVAHYRPFGLKIPAMAMNLVSDGAMLAAWLIAGFALLRRKP